MSAVPIDGGFWTIADPTRRIPGRFSAELGEKVEAALEARLAQPLGADNAPAPRPAFKQSDLAGAVRAQAAGAIAEFRAISFWGQLDTGKPVSVFDSADRGRRATSRLSRSLVRS
jgi:CubicO group peptidase (beta-lactamase class C family)